MALLGDILSVLSSRLPASAVNDELPKYNYPSAGHLYPVQTLVFVPSNNYLGYYHPLNNCLVELAPPVLLKDILDNYKQQNTPNPSASVIAFLVFVAEREAIEPVYGADLSIEFCYLEAGYMEELIQLSLQGILEQRNTTTNIDSISIKQRDDNLHKELGLTETQVPLHVLLLTQ